MRPQKVEIMVQRNCEPPSLRLHVHDPSSIVHEFHWGPRRLYWQGPGGGRDGKGAHLHWFVRHVVHRHTRQIRAVTQLRLRLEEERRAAAAAALAARRRDGRRAGIEGDGIVMVAQLSQGVGQVLGVHLRIGRILELHLPPVRRARRRADEKELAGVGQGQAVRRGRDGRMLAKVDAAAVAHDGLAVPHAAHSDGGVLVEKRNDDAAEGFERRPGVDRGYLLDEVADLLEVVGAEDVEVLEVGEDERVGGGRRLLERGEGREVERERQLVGASARRARDGWPCVLVHDVVAGGVWRGEG